MFKSNLITSEILVERLPGGVLTIAKDTNGKKPGGHTPKMAP